MSVSPEFVEIAEKISDEQVARISAQATGRPYKPFDIDTAINICFRIQNGESLKKILNDESFPSVPNFFSWLNSSKTLEDLYRRSRELRNDLLSESIRDIQQDASDVNRGRLEFDITKWILSKEKAGTYGDKIDLTSGGDPVKIMVSHGYHIEDGQIVPTGGPPGLPAPDSPGEDD